MKLGVQGQLTIPRDLLERFGWDEGTEVEAVPSGNGVLVRSPLRVREAGEEWRDPHTGKSHADMTPEERRDNVRRWIDQSAGTANSGLSTDEIMEMTRGEE